MSFMSLSTSKTIVDSHASHPWLSIIVPTCNRPEDLRKLLTCLAIACDRIKKDCWEVIVTDDAFIQEDAELLCKSIPWISCIKGPSRGPAANRNHAAKVAVGDWLVFLDDDCFPNADLLETYEGLANENSVTNQLVFMGATIPVETTNSLLLYAPNNPNGEAGISANFMVSRSNFLAYGGFDERYPGAAFEDTEFFLRLEKQGFEIKPVPNAIVYHPVRSIGNAFKRAKNWEARVIFAFDQGANSIELIWRLPLHVAKVCVSKLKRSKCFSRDFLRAVFSFSAEVILVFALTPLWVLKLRNQPRSKFWSNEDFKMFRERNYGF